MFDQTIGTMEAFKQAGEYEVSLSELKDGRVLCVFRSNLSPFGYTVEANKAFVNGEATTSAKPRNSVSRFEVEFKQHQDPTKVYVHIYE